MKNFKDFHINEALGDQNDDERWSEIKKNWVVPPEIKLGTPEKKLISICNDEINRIKSLLNDKINWKKISEDYYFYRGEGGKPSWAFDQLKYLIIQHCNSKNIPIFAESNNTKIDKPFETPLTSNDEKKWRTIKGEWLRKIVDDSELDIRAMVAQEIYSFTTILALSGVDVSKIDWRDINDSYRSYRINHSDTDASDKEFDYLKNMVIQYCRRKRMDVFNEIIDKKTDSKIVPISPEIIQKKWANVQKQWIDFIEHSSDEDDPLAGLVSSVQLLKSLINNPKIEDVYWDYHLVSEIEDIEVDAISEMEEYGFEPDLNSIFGYIMDDIIDYTNNMKIPVFLPTGPTIKLPWHK